MFSVSLLLSLSFHLWLCFLFAKFGHEIVTLVPSCFFHSISLRLSFILDECTAMALISTKYILQLLPSKNKTKEVIMRNSKDILSALGQQELGGRINA